MSVNSRQELLAFIAGDQELVSLHAQLRATLGEDPGHDMGHLERVALWTLRLGGDGIDPYEGVAAALLHDIVNVPKNSPDRRRASELCAAESRHRLAGSMRFDAASVERIAQAIEDHSFSRGTVPRSALGRALQDADRLEAVGAIGVARTFSTGARMGAAYFESEDPWASHRSRDDRAFTVDHFFEKLLRLHRTMCTDAGRREALGRTRWMRDFLEQLGAEIGHAPPADLLDDLVAPGEPTTPDGSPTA